MRCNLLAAMRVKDGKNRSLCVCYNFVRELHHNRRTWELFRINRALEQGFHSLYDVAGADPGLFDLLIGRRGSGHVIDGQLDDAR